MTHYISKIMNNWGKTGHTRLGENRQQKLFSCDENVKILAKIFTDIIEN